MEHLVNQGDILGYTKAIPPLKAVLKPNSVLKSPAIAASLDSNNWGRSIIKLGEGGLHPNSVAD